jgi:hypothetical protein
MDRATAQPDAGCAGGIRIGGENCSEVRAAAAGLRDRLRALGLHEHVAGPEPASIDGPTTGLSLAPAVARHWAPGGDTLSLAGRLGLDPRARPQDLEREIVACLLLAPCAPAFPSLAEFESAVRMRCVVVEAARRTALHFDTDAIERPQDCWRYHEDTGFTVRPGHGLVESIRRATQPEPGGPLYAFSCRRAGEYLLLLGIAQEAASCNPALLARLQSQAEQCAIQGEAFTAAFMRVSGSVAMPLPLRYFVPGDRVWFRNPDARSSDATGYEGSWVIYLGGGLFSNFWEMERPFSLPHKCVEIYHWRHAAHVDSQGTVRIDEGEVARRVAATFEAPREVDEIVGRMARLCDRPGVYANGGCIEPTREFARWVRPETSDIVLPAL